MTRWVSAGLTVIELAFAAGGTRRGLTLGWSTLRFDFAALLGLGAAPRNSLRALRPLC